MDPRPHPSFHPPADVFLPWAARDGSIYRDVYPLAGRQQRTSRSMSSPVQMGNNTVALPETLTALVGSVFYVILLQILMHSHQLYHDPSTLGTLHLPCDTIAATAVNSVERKKFK
ncbi:hypothetical protein ZWY2020_053488 [Hordeum vulgare]|nr:hypothetical protein ZWY2020_053488 [Hordeum vulgare]